MTDKDGCVTAHPHMAAALDTVSFHHDACKILLLAESLVQIKPETGFKMVLTHCAAEFASIASAVVGLAKLCIVGPWKENDDGQGISFY